VTPLRRVLVLGGTGFVGRATMARLMGSPQGAGLRVTVPSRRPAQHKALGTLPGVELVQADVHQPAVLRQLLAGHDAVLNLVAVLHADVATFRRVHVDLPHQLATACLATGVHRLVHVSALGVPEDPALAPSQYLRSKAEGEAVLRTFTVDRHAAERLSLTVLRPSVIFGAQDRFMNLFAQLQVLAPLLPLAGADARFQPVWVEDVAAALVSCLCEPASAGQTFEAAGPEVWTLAELVRAAGRWSGHARPVIPVPEWVGRLQAGLLGLLPGEPLLSADNLASMHVPNVATGRLPGLDALGVQPSGVASVMQPVLAQRDPAHRLDVFRARVHG
jgi:uncharacterized protein YbjT (DUF2867 family)